MVRATTGHVPGGDFPVPNRELVRIVRKSVLRFASPRISCSPVAAMSTDLIRYDLLAQEALRGVVRHVLADIAKSGMPGDHHFYITFQTRAPGVKLSHRLMAQYPEEMRIVLQHQFWDLVVTDDVFEVGLSFGGVPERLTVPFAAITGFLDPSVQFGLQFAAAAEADNQKPDAAASAKTPPGKTRPAKSGATGPAVRGSSSTDGARPAPAESGKAPARAKPTSERTGKSDDGPGPSDGGADVVRLDRFRKK